jgi:predicted metal-binding membrane protein
VMVAMVLIGTSNLVWMIALAAVMLLYKLAPLSTRRWSVALAAAVVALGAVYVVGV